MTALNERLQAPRAPISGWAEKKSGRFSISVTTRLLAVLPLQRVTRLDAECVRESGLTVIRGSVSEGVAPRVQPYILLATVGVSLALLLVEQIAAALGVLAVGGLLYLTVRADWLNSDKLLLEVERTLKASPKRPKPPEKAPAATAKAPTTTAAAAAAKKPAPPKK